MIPENSQKTQDEDERWKCKRIALCEESDNRIKEINKFVSQLRDKVKELPSLHSSSNSQKYVRY